MDQPTKDALKHIHEHSLYAVDNIRLAANMIVQRRNLTLTEDEEGFLTEAENSLAAIQQTIERLVPRNQLLS